MIEPTSPAASPDVLKICAYLCALLWFLPYLIGSTLTADIWFHVKAGAWILAHGIPHADPFSYTRAGHPWIDHEWLFQLMTYGVYRLGQEGGLMVVYAACIGALLLLFTREMIRSLPVSATITLSGVSLMLLRIRLTLAPELLTLLCTMGAVSLLALRRRRPGWVWMLVPLQLVWANLHGFAILGWGLTAWVVLGEWLLLRYPVRWWGAEGPDAAGLRRLARVGLAQALMLVVTPYGWQSLLYPLGILRSLTVHGQSLFGFVEELSPITIIRTGGYVGWFMAVAVAGGWSFAARHHRLDVGVLVPWLISAALGARVNRQVGFFVLLTGCAIAWNLRGLLPAGDAQDGSAVAAMPSGARRRWVWGIYACTVAGLIGSLWWSHVMVRTVRRAGVWVFDAGVPKGAVDFLLEHHAPGALFNTFNCGAYLIFRAWPAHRVFIDGRTELYGWRFIHDEYLAAIHDRAVWDRIVARYGIRTVLTDHRGWEGALLTRHLGRHPQWRLAYDDQRASIFLYQPQ